MDNFKLISQLKSYAENKGWHFLSGQNFNQNYEASQNEYEAGDLVLAVDFNATPSYGLGNKVTQIGYSGVMALGIKVDEENQFDPDAEETRANLDETFIQKYEARLEDLMQLLSNAIAEFACDNELEVTGVSFRMELNKFDTVIDFIAANITFLQ